MGNRWWTRHLSVRAYNRGIWQTVLIRDQIAIGGGSNGSSGGFDGFVLKPSCCIGAGRGVDWFIVDFGGPD